MADTSTTKAAAKKTGGKGKSDAEKAAETVAADKQNTDKEAEVKMKHLQAKYPADKHGRFAAVASACGMTNQEALRQAVDDWVADKKAALIASLTDD